MLICILTGAVLPSRFVICCIFWQTLFSDLSQFSPSSRPAFYAFCRSDPRERHFARSTPNADLRRPQLMYQRFPVCVTFGVSIHILLEVGRAGLGPMVPPDPMGLFSGIAHLSARSVDRPRALVLSVGVARASSGGRVDWARCGTLQGRGPTRRSLSSWRAAWFSGRLHRPFMSCSRAQFVPRRPNTCGLENVSLLYGGCSCDLGLGGAPLYPCAAKLLSGRPLPALLFKQPAGPQPAFCGPRRGVLRRVCRRQEQQACLAPRRSPDGTLRPLESFHIA